MSISDSVTAFAAASYYGDYIHYRRRDATPYNQDAYTLIDLGIRYEAQNGLSLRAGVTNAGAAQPKEDDSDSDIHLQGRAIYIGSSFSF